VTLIAIWSPLTIMSATLLCLTRILHAMGSDGVLPAALGRADRLGTPLAGLACSTAAALALVQVGGFESVATVASVFMFTGYLSALVSCSSFAGASDTSSVPRVGAPWTYRRDRGISPFAGGRRRSARRGDRSRRARRGLC
jgi:amino acid transporter